MINAITIDNFRGFRHVEINECRRVNVVVGDNGTGKTALLEAVFMALCASTDIAIRLRLSRGLEGNFSGASAAIEEAIFGSFFYARNMQNPIEIKLLGTGPEARTLRIARGGAGGITLPFGQALGLNIGSSAPITFTWRDHTGVERSAIAQVTPQGVQLNSTGEDLPNFFIFPSNQTTSATENATRFSDLSKARQERRFVQEFIREYNWIEDLSIEVVAGAPVIHATLQSFSEKIPITDVSGGINRIIAVLLALASKPKSVIVIDELENGIFFKHHVALWRLILQFIREGDGQVFISTHSEEWLEALAEAAGNDVDDIALWRTERGNDGPVVRHFSGKAFKAGLESGGEVR